MRWIWPTLAVLTLFPSYLGDLQQAQSSDLQRRLHATLLIPKHLRHRPLREPSTAHSRNPASADRVTTPYGSATPTQNWVQLQRYPKGKTAPATWQVMPAGKSQGLTIDPERMAFEVELASGSIVYLLPMVRLKVRGPEVKDQMTRDWPQLQVEWLDPSLGLLTLRARTTDDLPLLLQALANLETSSGGDVIRADIPEVLARVGRP